jgi:hypothetical protein
VQGRRFGKVVKLTNVKGKRWVSGGYYNRNYHGKGVYIGRLQQDRQGMPVEFGFQRQQLVFLQRLTVALGRVQMHQHPPHAIAGRRAPIALTEGIGLHGQRIKAARE